MDALNLTTDRVITSQAGRQVGLCPCGWIWVLPDHGPTCPLCHGEIKTPVEFHGFVTIPAEAFSNLEAEWLSTLDPAMYPPLDPEEEG